MPSDPIERLHRALGGAAAPSSDFDLNPGVTLDPARKLRPAAVLVAVQGEGAQARVLLTKRSSALKHHPGQIAFPGGKMDAGDESLVHTAQREAFEEVGLDPGNTDVLGHLPAHETVTGFTVTPVVARIHKPFAGKIETGEVDEMFFVPLDHVTNTANFQIQSRRWRGQRRYYYVVPFGPYYIWGATARILRGLAEQMARS